MRSCEQGLADFYSKMAAASHPCHDMRFVHEALWQWNRKPFLRGSANKQGHFSVSCSPSATRDRKAEGVDQPSILLELQSTAAMHAGVRPILHDLLTQRRQPLDINRESTSTELSELLRPHPIY